MRDLLDQVAHLEARIRDLQRKQTAFAGRIWAWVHLETKRRRAAVQVNRLLRAARPVLQEALDRAWRAKGF